MAGTITFGGIGSGMDTEGIVTALVGVERTNQKALSAKLSATNSSISNLSGISSLLSKLKSASDALDTASEVGSYKTTSSGAGIVASANGLAAPGKYSVTVDKLARESRNYSNTISSATAPMGQSGTLSLAIGGGPASELSISASDTIDDVIGKINGAGLRVNASAFFDGTNYRIQVRGLDTGAANAVTIGEAGTSFGFNDTDNVAQVARDAEIYIDKFKVTSATNQVTGAIRGVTLALTAESPDPITIGVDQDPDALKTKLTAMVDAYNAVVGKVKELAGNGTVKARDEMLAGDSTLRTLTSRLSQALQTQSGSGAYQTLSSVGLSLDRSGKLTLDSVKFDKAMTADAASVTKLLAGTDTTTGVMDVVSSTVDMFTARDKGLLTGKSDALQATTKRLQARIDREEIRVNRYADLLRKQFSQMDTQVAAWNSQGNYLSRQL